VVLEARSGQAQHTARPRLGLADPLAGDAELGAHRFERLGRLAVEAEAKREHAPHARVQLLERPGNLPPTCLLGGLLVRSERMDVLDQIAIEALPVADGRLEAD